MIPKTWFSTPLSKSAKDTEGRIRNIFEGQRRRPAVLVLALVAAAALLCGSVVAIRLRNGEEAGKDGRKRVALEALPEDYSLEQAKADGCVVMEDGQLTAGRERFLHFAENPAQDGSVRVVHYYTLDDPSRYAPELYEEIKDSYPHLFVHDLICNGKEGYIWRGCEDDELIVERKYHYMLRMEAPPDGPAATWDHAVRYVLVNDADVTWKDIWTGMISSQSNAYIDHAVVYQEYVYSGSETLRGLFARLAPEDVRLTYFEGGGKQKKTVEGASALLAADYLAMLADTEWADAYPMDEDDRADTWRVVLETPGWRLTCYQGRSTVLLEKDGEALWLAPRYLPDVGFGGDNTYSAPETWYRDALAAETHRRAQIEAFPNDRPLTGEELSSWRETLKSEESFLDETWGGYTARSTVVSCFFTSYYSDPRDLDLSGFLDYCPLGEVIGTGDGTMTEAEHEAIVAALGGHDPSRVVPTHRYRASDINAALMQYAGVTLDDLRVDWRSSGEVLYLSEYDAFYNFTSDWGPGLFFPRYGELRDNVLTLWSDNAAVEIVLSGGGWHMQAHMAIADAD